METVKAKLVVDPDTGMVFLRNDSDQVLEIAMEGVQNQDPQKPFHLKKDSTLFLRFHS